MKKNILISGGAGFIGSHLCKYLLNKNHYVICLDNLLTGSLKNISDVINNPNFEFVDHDITIPYFRDNLDEIYNLACPASPVHYQKIPIKTIKTCVLGVINMLDLAKKNNAKILQASTSEVYGDPISHPQKENYNGNVNPTGPRSCYDEGKRCAETLFMDYYRTYNLKIKIIRIFNTYGPNMAINDGRVVSNFINQAINDINITINGNGSQTRCFQYIDDLILGITKFMDSKNNFVGPVNMGSPNEISMNQLASIIIRLTNSRSNIIFQDLPIDDPKKRKPDLSIANKEIGWHPTTDLETGLKKTIHYFNHLSDENQIT
tara:strand:- start:12686 stop:13642 length:957 start_codon:yes stop_codon:yes gene_type:complete